MNKLKGVVVIKIYYISIAMFYLSVILLAVRYLISKNEIKLNEQNEGLFTLIRFIGISIFPIINIGFTILFLYLSILTNKEEFIKAMNEKGVN